MDFVSILGRERERAGQVGVGEAIRKHLVEDLNGCVVRVRGKEGESLNGSGGRDKEEEVNDSIP